MLRILLSILTGVALLLFVGISLLWIRSYWTSDYWSDAVGRWRVEYMDPDGQPDIAIFHDDTPVGQSWQLLSFPRSTRFPLSGYHHFSFQWQPAARSGWPPGIVITFADMLRISVPWWFLCLVLGVLPAARFIPAMRSRRRKRRLAGGLCPACGYDLRASPGKCPECGSEPISVRSAGRTISHPDR